MLRSKGTGGTGPTAGASQAAQLSATEQDRSYKSTTAPRPLLLCYFVTLLHCLLLLQLQLFSLSVNIIKLHQQLQQNYSIFALQLQFPTHTLAEATGDNDRHLKPCNNTQPLIKSD